MKIKNLTIFTIAIAILCTAARTVTLLYATEAGTGFFISRLSDIGVALSISIFLLVLIALIFSFSAKEKAKQGFTLSKISGAVSVILGIAILSYSLGLGSHSYLLSWQHTLETVTGILSSLWFMAYGVSAFVDITLPAITAIFPCIHSIMRLIVVFGTFSTSALVAEHVFSLAYHVSVMLFMLYFGRIVASVPQKKSGKTFFPVTVCAFIFTCTSVFSRLLMLFLSKTEMIHGETALDITGIVLSVFMLSAAADICKEEKEEIPDDIQC